MKTLPADLELLLGDFFEHLTAQGKAPTTVKTYVGYARRFARFQVDQDLATDVTEVERRHVAAYLRFAARGNGQATHVSAYNSLRSFFAYLIEVGEIDASPIIGVPRPKDPPLAPVPILPDDAPQRMIHVAQEHRHGLWALRDEAIIRLFWDTPARISELANLTVTDVDLEERSIQVLGKGSKWRQMRFDRQTAKVLRRYIAARKHRWTPELGDHLWVGKGGGRFPRPGMTKGGIYEMIQRTGQRAGLGNIRPHQFRHTFADRWLQAGGGEIDLLQLGGWSSPKMLMRYGRAGAERRALSAYDRVLKK